MRVLVFKSVSGIVEKHRPHTRGNDITNAVGELSDPDDPLLDLDHYLREPTIVGYHTYEAFENIRKEITEELDQLMKYTQYVTNGDRYDGWQRDQAEAHIFRIQTNIARLNEHLLVMLIASYDLRYNCIPVYIKT